MENPFGSTLVEFRALTQLWFLNNMVQVDSLISNDKWRQDLIDILFCIGDCHLILNLLICAKGRADQLVCHYTRFGRFSVSSSLGWDAPPARISGRLFL